MIRAKINRRAYCARHWMVKAAQICAQDIIRSRHRYMHNNKSFYNSAKLKQGLVANSNNLSCVPTELCSQGNGRLREVGLGITSGAITHLNKNIYPWYFT